MTDAAMKRFDENCAAISNALDGRILRIIFDGPPGPTAGRFVDVHNADDKSFNAGTWHERPDGFWELRIARAVLTDTAREGEYERGWKAAQEACRRLVGSFPTEHMRSYDERVAQTAILMLAARDIAAMSPAAPSNVGTGEGA